MIAMYSLCRKCLRIQGEVSESSSSTLASWTFVDHPSPVLPFCTPLPLTCIPFSLPLPLQSPSSVSWVPRTSFVMTIADVSIHISQNLPYPLTKRFGSETKAGNVYGVLTMWPSYSLLSSSCEQRFIPIYLLGKKMKRVLLRLMT